MAHSTFVQNLSICLIKTALSLPMSVFRVMRVNQPGGVCGHMMPLSRFVILVPVHVCASLGCILQPPHSNRIFHVVTDGTVKSIILRPPAPFIVTAWGAHDEVGV